MTTKIPSLRLIQDVGGVRLAQVGAVLLALGLWGCGGGFVSDSGTGGSSSGGTGDTGGSSSGGASSGGAASGGSSSGGTSSGGSSSGGSGGGVAEIVNACPGVPAGSTAYPACRSQADCSFGSCQPGPLGGNVCGACFLTTVECDTDPDCDDDLVCVTKPAEPCQCMGGDRLCEPACTSDSCEADEACGADGHCGPASCVTDGYACLSDSICDAERGGDAHDCAPRLCDSEDYTCADGQVCDPAHDVDGHGCRPVHCSEGAECPVNFACIPEGPGTGCQQLSCTEDDDCDCGACIAGHCEQHLFMCVSLPA